MTAKKESPEKLFAQITQVVTDSRELLNQGALMELAGLDEQVRSLCDSVLHLSDAERLLYADKLQQLLGELKQLGDELAKQRDAVGEELLTVSAHRKANVAYRTADATDDFGTKKKTEDKK